LASILHLFGTCVHPHSPPYLNTIRPALASRRICECSILILGGAHSPKDLTEGAAEERGKFCAPVICRKASFAHPLYVMASSLASDSVGHVCLGPDATHVPTQKSAKGGGRAYYLFKAAEDGCLSCVRKLIEKLGIDLLAFSTIFKYPALDPCIRALCGRRSSD